MRPTLHQVREVMWRHAQLLVDYFESEDRACRDLRKHMAWYLKGFRVEGDLRPRFGMVGSLKELRELLDQLIDQPYPIEISESPRGRRSHSRAVTLPQGWLDDPDEIRDLEYTEAGSGG